MKRLFTVAAAAFVCLPLGLSTASAATLRAAPATINSVMASAAPGDIIELASGAYSEIRPPNKSGVVTIRPAGGATVTVADVDIENVSNWAFTANGATQMTVGPVGGVYLQNASNITIDHVNIIGDPATYQGGLFGGIAYNAVTNLTVTNNIVRYWTNDVQGRKGVNITIASNDLSYTQSDVIHIGGDHSHLDIENNYIHDAGPNSGYLLHQDAIQIFGSGAGSPLTYITIKNNIIVRGSGAPLQCIFTEGDSSTTQLQHVLIQGNLCMMGNWWGIGYSTESDLTITGNYTGGYTDAIDPGSSQVMTPWIKGTTSNAVTITNNQTVGGVIDGGGNTNYSPSGSASLSNAPPGDLTAAATWWCATHGGGAWVVSCASADAAQVADLKAQLAAAQTALSTAQAKIAKAQADLK